MRLVRALIRTPAFLLLTFVLMIVWVLGNLVLMGSPARRNSWRGTIQVAWARLTARLFNLQVSVEGKPPNPPFLLVANHISYIDVIALLTQRPSVFVSKAEVRNWPIIGPLARYFGTIFLDRGRKRQLVDINETIRNQLAAGFGVVFFPEGTSHMGDKVYPFKTSLLTIPVELELPVSFAAIRYETGPKDIPAYQSIAFWGEVGFMDHLLRLLGVSQIKATVSYGDQPVSRSDRKELGKELHRKVASLFEPMISEEEGVTA